MLLTARDLTGSVKFDSKFVRVGNEVYITEANDIRTIHRELAEKHKILDRVYDLKEQNPDNVDGGYIFVSGRLIKIAASSTSLSLPLTDEARKNTIKILKRSFPDFSIKELAEE